MKTRAMRISHSSLEYCADLIINGFTIFVETELYEIGVGGILPGLPRNSFVPVTAGQVVANRDDLQ